MQALVLCHPGGIPTWGSPLSAFFLPSAKCEGFHPLFSAKAALREPLRQGLKPFGLPDSLCPLSSQSYPSLPLLSSPLLIGCQGRGVLGQSDLKWSSISLAPREATTQNFSSALSNWTLRSLQLFSSCPVSFPPWEQKVFVPNCKAPEWHHSMGLPLAAPQPARGADCTQ